jgi:hypothetical protein
VSGTTPPPPPGPRTRLHPRERGERCAPCAARGPGPATRGRRRGVGGLRAARVRRRGLRVADVRRQRHLRGHLVDVVHDAPQVERGDRPHPGLALAARVRLASLDQARSSSVRCQELSVRSCAEPDDECCCGDCARKTEAGLAATGGDSLGVVSAPQGLPPAVAPAGP